MAPVKGSGKAVDHSAFNRPVLRKMQLDVCTSRKDGKNVKSHNGTLQQKNMHIGRFLHPKISKDWNLYNPLLHFQQVTDPQGFCFCFSLHRAASEAPGRCGCKIPGSIPKISHKTSNHMRHMSFRKY